MFKARKVRSSRWLSIVSCMVMLLAGLSACAQDQSTTGGATFTNPNPITIGFTVSLSKNKDTDFTADGQLILQGYQLWADTVNQNGGILGRQVVLKYYDDHSAEATTTQRYTDLIKKDKVDLLFGPFSTLLTKAAEAATGISAYPFVEGAGGAPSVFTDPNTGQNPRWTNIFATSVPVVNNLDAYAYYILSLPLSQRPHTVAYLSSDDPFTFPQINRAQQLLTQGGLRTVFPTSANFKQYKQMPQFQYGPQYEYGEGDNNATAEATANAEAIVKANPDIVVLGTLLPDIQAEIAVFKKDHFRPKSLIATAGPDLGSDFIKAIKGVQYAEGIFVPNGWYPQANNFQNAEMVQAYINKFSTPTNQITPDQVNADVAEAYSVGQVTQQAVEKVGSLDKAKLISELHSDVFNTVQGTAQFAQDGHNTQGLAYLFQWQKGVLIPVYPLSVAAENPEYKSYNF
jgi:branched-chain amino acid transport system substrate-binding protein